MKQLSPYEVMQREVDQIASQITDPETAEFSEFFLNATAVLSSYGDQNQTRNAILCGYAIRSLSDEDRASFLASVEVTGRVYQELSSPSDWPVTSTQEQPDD